jgi:hypothetical protein
MKRNLTLWMRSSRIDIHTHLVALISSEGLQMSIQQEDETSLVFKMAKCEVVLQEEIASSRRSSANSEIVPGQAWPKKSAPLPTKDSAVPRYEPYAQRQPQQSRQEWAANSPQNMKNGEAR